jgi:hypothetical protein
LKRNSPPFHCNISSFKYLMSLRTCTAIKIFGIGQLPSPGYATAQLQTIDLFKMYISLLIGRMAHFCISFFRRLIRFIKKTKYTTRCSVQSSTIYKVKLFLIVYFLFSNKAQFSANIFRSVEIWFRRIFVDFEHKNYNCKITSPI